MMSWARPPLWLPLLACGALLAGGLWLYAGSGAQVDPGVVATVNGQPITLREVEAVHDLQRLDEQGDAPKNVETLRREYLAVVQDLVAQRLVMQELARRGQAVDAAELAGVEAAVRAQYPQGAFEQLLVDESLDLDIWRQRLRARLSVRAFIERVLRPQENVSAAEVEAYYRDYQEEFRHAPGIELLVLQGAEADLAKAAGEIARGAAPGGVLAGMAAIEARPMRTPEQRLPPAWRQASLGLKPGQVSEYLPGEQPGHGARLVLVARHAAELTSFDEARPGIEQRLLTAKAETRYTEWLAQALAQARVRISAQLLTTAGDDSAAPREDVDEAPPPDDVLSRDDEVTPQKGAPPGPDGGQ